MMYVILGLAFAALYFVIRSGAKAEVKQEIAEAKVGAVTKTIKESNAIEQNNSTLSDEQLDDKLFGRGDN